MALLVIAGVSKVKGLADFFLHSTKITTSDLLNSIFIRCKVQCVYAGDGHIWHFCFGNKWVILTKPKKQTNNQTQKQNQKQQNIGGGQF